MKVVGNISSVITCVAFFMLILGRIWRILENKNIIFADYNFENAEVIDENDIYYIDRGNEYGQLLSLSSPKGIRSIKIYDVQLDYNGDIRKLTLVDEVKHINNDVKFYIRVYLYEFCSNTYLEVERGDYVKHSFIIADSGKDGSFVPLNEKR